MPKRTDLQKIAIIGAGPIVIGQACEFDYSGTQALEALREAGFSVVLINSNPATVMTDPEKSEATYIEPLTTNYVRAILEKERPDALLPTVGGQTALNIALALAQDGSLEALGIELIGASEAAILCAEDRAAFQKIVEGLGLACPRSRMVHSEAEAETALKELGLPLILRPSFTLGGEGGGVAETPEDYHRMIRMALASSSIGSVLVDESIIGWKEFELEVIRDQADRAMIICSIENIDPMGVHTGDSITVAPALTLSDKEYQAMRQAAFAIIRAVGVATGGANVQFAVHPETGDMRVIEMNPRVSRSSALASKATGFPIAKVAAKLAVGYCLDEIAHGLTLHSAAFEPALDYVVVKIPRFAFDKFRRTDRRLGTSMQSVGEVMGIGRCFEEAFQKALQSMEVEPTGLMAAGFPSTLEGCREALRIPTPERFLLAAHGLRLGLDEDQIHRLTFFDRWFLRRLVTLVEAEKRCRMHGLPQTASGMLGLKQLGFSDWALGVLTGHNEAEVRAHRQRLGVCPVYKMIDSCAGEWASEGSYLYSTYEAPLRTEHGASEHTDRSLSSDGIVDGSENRAKLRKKVVVVGSGPNRIGQGIEFDYACVHALEAVRASGALAIMVNCNPETVSTDVDRADRLYFEPLTQESLRNILEAESTTEPVTGLMMQCAGQTGLRLSELLSDSGVALLGSSPETIRLAENREAFYRLLHGCGMLYPPSAIVHDVERVVEAATNLGYPLLVRPSYVIGGQAMEIVYHETELLAYVTTHRHRLVYPLLLDRFLGDSVEIDVDILSDGKDVCVMGVMEHVEQAGVHSGDSACSLPPFTLGPTIVEDIIEQSIRLTKALGVVGCLNIQYALQSSCLYVLEANPRASRTLPFVAKALGLPLARWAASIMLGSSLKDLGLPHGSLSAPKHRFAVKLPVFPFARFQATDILLGPEMQSTGEVMGVASSFSEAYAKAQLGAGQRLSFCGTVLLSVKDSDKMALLPLAHRLIAMGWSLVATRGTAAFLEASGVPVKRTCTVREGSPHVLDAIEGGEIALVINTSASRPAASDSFVMRRAALMRRIPYAVTMEGARALVRAIAMLPTASVLDTTPLQCYNMFTLGG